MLSRNAVSSCRCLNLARHTQRRTLARSLTTATETSNTPSSSSSEPPAPKSRDATIPDRPKALIDTSVILTRAPFLTRIPSPFERAYYAYQSRIQRALFTPFPSEFYFKPGSLIEGQFAKEEEAREREAFGRQGPPEKEPAEEAAAPVDPLATEVEVEQPMPRESEADRTGDVRSLDRKGERNMYLLVQGQDKVWRFPQGPWKEGELLHEAAERDLKERCGAFMDTWIVARNPIGVYEPPAPSSVAGSVAVTPKKHVFFFKAHILAGQVRPDGKGVVDFAWLTKEEIEKRVDEKYWAGVKDMLSDY